MDTNIPSKENSSVRNIQDDDRLCLSSKEWSLLTYIVRTYDVDTALQISENSHSKKRKQNFLNLEFFQEYNKRPKILPSILPSNQSLLSKNQWALLSNLIQSYDTFNTIPIIQTILAKQTSYQPRLRFKLNHTLKIINKFFLSINLCMNNIISHTMIDEDCQERMVRYNFRTLGCLNGLFIGRETYLLHNPAHSMNFRLIYGEDLMFITNRLIYQLEQNDVLFKLFIVVLSYSTHLSVLSYSEDCLNENTRCQWNRYENIFINLLWRYMMYKYDLQECISRYSMMIKIVLDLLNQMYQAEELKKD